MQKSLGEDCPNFIFAISLKPRQMSEDWNLVLQNLTATVRSIQSSSSNRFLIAIACHDLPDIDHLKNDQLIILPAPFDQETDWKNGAIDKVRKRRHIGAWVRQRLGEDEAGSYVMFLDADDLVHKDLVKFVTENDNGKSYIVSKGYVFDAATTRLSRLETFDRSCGSCFIGYFTKDELPGRFDDENCPYYLFDRHNQFKVTAEKLGKTPAVVPFYAMTYITNHTESLRRKRLGGVNRKHGKRAYSNRAARKILLQDFAYTGLSHTKPPGIVGAVLQLKNWLSDPVKRRIARHLATTTEN